MELKLKYVGRTIALGHWSWLVLDKNVADVYLAKRSEAEYKWKKEYQSFVHRVDPEATMTTFDLEEQDSATRGKVVSGIHMVMAGAFLWDLAVYYDDDDVYWEVSCDTFAYENNDNIEVVDTPTTDLVKELIVDKLPRLYAQALGRKKDL